ncbi:hypothetical protein [Vibrio sp. 10N.261.51.C6]|uniref:hypothetical protein n=1 Tax=Vibrio sp. 10N.261.51.C6 TaxID=3229676 RepID=UPI0035521270
MRALLNWKLFALLILIFIAVVEFIAREYIGLGEVPTYVFSDKYEYIYSPNINVTRFKNEITTNSFSMRSEELINGEEYIAIMGDSIVNGGVLTDHNSLATTILFPEFSTLNISAGSWGPENAFEYWKDNSDLHFKKVILVFSSHDYYDYIEGKNVVCTLNYPCKQPMSAITDGFFKYFIPLLKSKLVNNTGKGKLDELEQQLELSSGWLDIINYARELKIPLHVVLHPDKDEVISGEYNYFGQKIIDFLEGNGVEYTLELDNGVSEDYYRDRIHYNDEGQKFLAKIIKGILDK